MKIYNYYIIAYLTSLLLLMSLLPIYLLRQNEYFIVYLYAILGIAGSLYSICKRILELDYILFLLICFVLYNLNGILKYDYYQIVVLFFVIYSFSKKISSHPNLFKALVTAIICSGIWQSTIALLQYFHYLHSDNLFFAVTGHFDNPGPLGGYIAVCLLTTINCCTNFRIHGKAKAILMMRSG